MHKPCVIVALDEIESVEHGLVCTLIVYSIVYNSKPVTTRNSSSVVHVPSMQLPAGEEGAGEIVSSYKKTSLNPTIAGLNQVTFNDEQSNTEVVRFKGGSGSTIK